MTTVPFMSTTAIALLIASTARRSAADLLPRPCSGAAARAPAPVTRRSSRASVRLGRGARRRPPRLSDPEELQGQVAVGARLDHLQVLSAIAAGSLADAPAPDRQ